MSLPDDKASVPTQRTARLDYAPPAAPATGERPFAKLLAGLLAVAGVVLSVVGATAQNESARVNTCFAGICLLAQAPAIRYQHVRLF